MVVSRGVAARVLLVVDSAQEIVYSTAKPSAPSSIQASTRASTPATSPSVSRSWSRWIILAVLTLAIEAVYVFFATAGSFIHWPGYNSDFDLLAEGFRSGHLHLSIAPAPQLLAQPDPYDVGSSQWWYPDLTLYKRQYFLYWGPVPALLIAAAKILFRIKATVGDQYPQFAFYSIYLVAGVLFIDRAARHLYPRLPLYWVVVAILLYAFANPTPYLVATPSVYLTAISGSQAFLMLGLLFALAAFCRTSRAAEPDRARLHPVLSLAAGLSWALSIGCRVSTGPVVLLLVLLTVLLARVPTTRWRNAVVNFTLLAAPVAIGGLVLLLYNKLRFNSWLEFGMSYQLNTWHFRMSLSYLAPNLYSYLLRPLGRSCHFPFLSAIWTIGDRGFPRGLSRPLDYLVSEPVVGLLNGTPWSWLSLIAVAVCARMVWVARRRPGGMPATDDVSRGQIWCTAGAAIIGSVTCLPVIAVFSTTIRYMADVSTGIVLCAIFGGWWLYLRVRERPALRRSVTAAMLALAGVTVGIGLLLGFTGYNDHFVRFNPTLFDRFHDKLSVCPAGD
jgi:hypothetical protein